MKYLSLTIPGANKIVPPAGVPTGGADLTLSKVVAIGLDLLIILAILLCLVFIIWGAINWIMSEGDKQKLNQARQKIIFAVIGIIVVFLAFFIVNFVLSLFLGWDMGGGGGRKKI